MNMQTQRSLIWPIRSGYDVVRIPAALVLLRSPSSSTGRFRRGGSV